MSSCVITFIGKERRFTMTDSPHHAAIELLELPVFELQGTPRELGEQLGEATRTQTRELFESRLAAAIGFARDNSGRVVTAEQVLDVARRGLVVTENYD